MVPRSGHPERGTFNADELSGLVTRQDLVAAALRPKDLDQIPATLDLATTALDAAPSDAWCGRALLPDPDVRLIAMLAGKATLDREALTHELLGHLTDSGHKLRPLHRGPRRRHHRPAVTAQAGGAALAAYFDCSPVR